MTFGIFTAVLALAAGLLYRAKLRRFTGKAPLVTDDMIRRIEEHGRVDVEEDEPLDLRAIREEEDRFFEETWDEPDEM